MEREFITKRGIDKLTKELAALIRIKRPEIAARIKEAVSFGDLTENSEYAEAKDEQAFMEGRIMEIEEILRSAELVQPVSRRSATSVQIGCAVELSGAGGRKKLTIVGKGEGDPLRGEISSDSPIGQAILGRTPGESVLVPTPKGIKQYKVVKIA